MTITSLLEKVRSYSALVVGDGIIDEYVYVKPQGKSPKENIITNKILRCERFYGGVWAAAKHVQELCEVVDIQMGRMVTTKRRFVEEQYLSKLFEVHDCGALAEEMPTRRYPEYDLVIVTDFGHGCVTGEMIETMSAEATFLAVNAQTNSANHGFNLITKYQRADYVVIDELEARLAAHDRDSPIEAVIEKLDFPRIIVTLGASGSIGCYHGEFYRAPSRAGRIIDTMGAGDAFFCVTAPLAAAGADMQTLVEVGNAAGAIKCGVVGHRQPVTPAALLRHIAASTCISSAA